MGRSLLVLAPLVLLGAAPAARAGVLTMQTKFDSVQVELGGITGTGWVPMAITSQSYLGGGTEAAGVGALATQQLVDGQVVATYLSFCVDIANNLDQRPESAVVSTITTNPGGSDPRNLLAAGWVLSEVVAPGRIGSYLAGTTGSVDQAAKNAAVQLAIWELVFDPNPGDVAAGDFHAANLWDGWQAEFATAARIANNIVGDWLAHGSPGMALGLVDYPPSIAGGPGGFASQDQAFYAAPPFTPAAVVPAPEPATVVLGLIGGAAGLLGRFGRRRARA